jgi:hypothetical protein
VLTIKLQPVIKHLSQPQLEELMVEYYDGKCTVKSLLVKFKIKGHSSQLVSYFPPLILGEECEYCRKPLLKNRSPRTGSSTSQPYCPTCNHKVGRFYCGCGNCQKRNAEQKQQQAEQNKRKMEEKKQTIIMTYDPNLFQRVEEQHLTLFQRLSLAALLRLGLNEEGKVINPPIGYLKKLTPQPEFSRELLLALTKPKIIIPDINSRIDAFEDGDDFPNNYFISYVSYFLNLAPEDGDTASMFQRLLMPDPALYNNQKVFCFEVWKAIAISEVLEYLNYSIEKIGFELNPGEKTMAILSSLLEDYSVSQLYSIIYRSIANTAKFYQENKITRKHAGNMVVTHIQRYGERAKAEGWEIKGFSRNYNLPQTAISEIFFNRILNIGSLGFEVPPTKEL